MSSYILYFVECGKSISFWGNAGYLHFILTINAHNMSPTGAITFLLLEESIHNLVFVPEQFDFGADQAVFFQQGVVFVGQGRNIAAFEIDLGIDENFGEYDDKDQKNYDKNIAQKQRPHRFVRVDDRMGLV